LEHITGRNFFGLQAKGDRGSATTDAIKYSFFQEHSTQKAGEMDPETPLFWRRNRTSEEKATPSANRRTDEAAISWFQVLRSTCTGEVRERNDKT